MEQREMKQFLHRYDRSGRKSQKQHAAIDNAWAELFRKRRERERREEQAKEAKQ